MRDSEELIAHLKGLGSGKIPPIPPVADPDDSREDGDMNERLAKIESTLPTLATKSDVSGVNVAVESVRAEIHRGIIETQRWMIATVIGLFVGFGGLFLAMSNALKPGQQPIVISIPGQLSPAQAQGSGSGSGSLSPSVPKTP